MLFGTFEVSFSSKKSSLPGPSINAASIDGNRYSDDYLFDAVDGPPLTQRQKLEQPPADIEIGTATLPKTGGHKFAPTLKKC